MSNTGLLENPRRLLRAEADAELAGVFGGAGIENLPVRAKWYVSGLWPFRFISFECPGCSRWLAVKSAFSGRIGFCPSCDLTVATPDIKAGLDPALISQAKEIPALPARRLPAPRTARSQPASGWVPTQPAIDHSTTKDLHRLSPDRLPEWNRQHAFMDGEQRWGIGDGSSLVPLAVVKRFQAVKPWLGCAALLLAACAVGYAFTVSQRDDGQAEIPSIHAPREKSPIPLGSELWVVLDALATATTPEEMVSLVRKPAEMLPKMRAYYADADVSLPHRFERARPGLKVYQLGQTRFARFEGRCDGRPVKFSFEATEFGWRLDWESLVGFSETNWRDFLSERPSAARPFRVLANVHLDESLPYDHDKYLCLHLVDHLETAHGFALLDRFGEQAMQLEKFLRIDAATKGPSPRTWITPVLRPKPGSDQLLELVSLKSASWLVP